jgi:hypothetical protein
LEGDPFVTFHLSLSNLEVDIHKLTAPNLTHLFLASTRSEFIDMTTLLDFLERSPLLEDFELRYPGPRGVDIAHPDHVVSLKHLRRIILWDRGSMFLNHLVLPYGIECELNFLFTDVSATTGFFEEMFGGASGKAQADFPSGVLEHRSALRSRFRTVFGAQWICGDLPDVFPRRKHFHTRFITYPTSVLKKVKNLFVGSRDGAIPEWKSTDVRKHLNKMPSLESLTVMHCNNASFIQALLPSEGKVPCPTLKNLTIYIGPTETFNIPAFRSMVEQRGSHGHKFEKMLLVFCYEHRIDPSIPNLEVKVDDRALFWDSKKKFGGI